MASPLVSRSALFLILFFISCAVGQSIDGASFFPGNGAPGAGQYGLVDDYEGSSDFFGKFNYYSSYDPTYGHVQYVNETVAVQNGYTKTSKAGTAVIGVDTTNLWPTGGPGRPSVRLISDNTYTHGLFILDVLHMPWGCGTWPAYWLLGPEWPSNGEIDIIEGVNTIGWDSVTLHTTDGCTISGSGQSGVFQTDDCSGGCGSILNNTVTPNNYGATFNNISGGVYATEWTSDYIKTWFFPRSNIPASITSGSPDPNADFGIPAVNSEGPCPFDQHFANMSIIINIDFCGAWAGEVYASQYPNCPQNASAPNSLDSCVDFVGLNPKAFVDAYWEIDSIKVYQMPVNATPTSSYSTSLSSTTAMASTQSVIKGMGATTTNLSSTVYTGPLSSSSSTTSSLPAASTGQICPAYNNTVWTDAYGQQYTIGCGLDYNSPPASVAVQQVASFEACLEFCDGLKGCRAASFVADPGTCYPHAGTGGFVYKNNTNAGLRIAGPVSVPVSAYPSSGTTSSMTSSTTSSSTTSSSSTVSSTTSISTSTSKASSSSSSGSTSSLSTTSSTVSSGTSSSTTASSSTSSGITSTSSSITSTSSSITSTASAVSNMTSMSSSTTNSTPTSQSTASGTSSSSTASTPQATTSSLSTTVQTAQRLSTCPPSACNSPSATASLNSSCRDPYDNDYAVTCGEVYSGTRLRAVAASNLNVCLVKCDVASGCAAVNFVNGTCTLLANVTGTMTVAERRGYAAATRPANVSTVYSTPPPNSYGFNSTTSKSSVSGYGSTSSIPGYGSTSPSSELFTTYVAPTTTRPSDTATTLPACPTNTAAICAAANGTTTCSSSNEEFTLSCDEEYTGTILKPARNVTHPSGNSTASKLMRRAHEDTIKDCQTLCHDTPGCVALNYDHKKCTLFSSISGTSYVPGAVAGSVVPASSAPQSTSTLSSTSGATVTVTPTSTVVSTVSAGSHRSTSSPTAGNGSGGSSVSLCYTCALTPTVVTGSQSGASAPRTGGASPTSMSTCKPYPALGTTTFFTTHTITSCVIPGVCPAPGYVFGGNATQIGATVVTTTDKSGHAVTYTQIPSGPPGRVKSVTVVTTNRHGHTVTYTELSTQAPRHGSATVVTTTDRHGHTVLYTELPGETLVPTAVTTVDRHGHIHTHTELVTERAHHGHGHTEVVTTTNRNGQTVTYTQSPGGDEAHSRIVVVTTTDKHGHTIVKTETVAEHHRSKHQHSVVIVETTTNKHGHTVTSTFTRQTGGRGGTGTKFTRTATATNTAQPTCPYSDDGEFTSPLGDQYGIFCGEAYTGHNLDTQRQTSFGSCISACDQFNLVHFTKASPCLGVTYYPSRDGQNCELKSSLNVEERAGANSARLLTAYTGPGKSSHSSRTHGNTITSMSHTAAPHLTTFISGGSTVIETKVRGGSTYLSTYIVGGTTKTSTHVVGGTTSLRTITSNGRPEVSTVIKGGSTHLSTYVVGGKTKTGKFTTGGSTVLETLTLGGATVVGTISTHLKTYVTGGVTEKETFVIGESTIVETNTRGGKTLVSTITDIVERYESFTTYLTTYVSDGKTKVRTIATDIFVTTDVQGGPTHVHTQTDSIGISTDTTAYLTTYIIGGKTSEHTVTAPDGALTTKTHVKGGSTVVQTLSGPPEYLTTSVIGGTTKESTLIIDGSTTTRTQVKGGSTVVATITPAATYLSTYITGGVTRTTTFVSDGSTVTRTHVSGGATVTASITVGGGGGSGNGGAGNGPGAGSSLVPTTYTTVIPVISTFVSRGVTYQSTEGYKTEVSVSYRTTKGSTSTTTTTTITTSRVPTTYTTVIPLISTFVSNGNTYQSTEGYTTEVTVSYRTVSSTSTTTTTTTATSISTANHNVTVLTEGPGQYITVTASPSIVTSYVTPQSSSSSFTCRTYATNYLNGYHGKVKRTDGRSVFDIDTPLILGSMGRPARPGAVPKL